MKPKIAIFLYSLGGGGAERVVSILLHKLHEKYNITLVLMNTTIAYDIPKTIPIHYLGTSSATEIGLWKLLKLPLLAWKYVRFCEHHGITLSFSLMNRPNYINILSKFFGNKAKIIISERGTPSQQYSRSSLQGTINRFLIRWLYPKANLITTNSEGSRFDLIHNFNIIQPITVLYNLFELPQYLKKNILHAPTLISIGRLDRGKHHLLLLEALAKLPQRNLKLLILGEGPLRKNLEEAIIHYNLQEQVELKGFISNPFEYLAQADIFLFASRHEGFPNVLIEALGSGCAVISTDCPSGPREILSPSTPITTQLSESIEYAPYGVLIPVDDAERMKEALQNLLDHPEKLCHYQTQSVLRAHEFDQNILLANYEQLFNKAFQ